jgi:signal transduction histidine kinase
MRRKSIAFTDASHRQRSSGKVGRPEDQPRLQVRCGVALVAMSLFTSLLLSVPVFALDVSLPSRVSLAHHRTDWFLAICAVVFLAVLWVAYQLHLRRLHYQFEMRLEARVGERTRIARDLHDTLLQSFHGLLLQLETVSVLLPESEAKTKLDSTIQHAADAIAEGRDAVQGLRVSTVECSDLAQAISTLGKELATTSNNDRSAAFVLTVEGKPRDLHPIVRDNIYKISAEALRNAFRHALAERVEVEIRYDNEQFRLRVRDDGKGIDPAILSGQRNKGHYGLYGMRQRATLIGGNLAVWSEVGAGTEVELRVPSNIAFAAVRKQPRLVHNSAGIARA